MKQVTLTIQENTRIAGNVWKMSLYGDVSAITKPGQFINLALPGHFLRRPISVCDVVFGESSIKANESEDNQSGKQSFLERLENESHLVKEALRKSRSEGTPEEDFCKDCGILEFWNDGAEFGTVTILYKIAGKGTAEMTEMPAGTKLDVLTGLGNGFDISRVREGQTALLLGGGIGSAPMLMLTKQLKSRGVNVHAVLGFNTAEEIILAEELHEAGAEVTVMTADGSGIDSESADSNGISNSNSNSISNNISIFKGFATEAPIVQSGSYDFFYACGPMPMLKAVYRACPGEGELSFEERMGCGFGACMGCSMQTASGPKRVCKDGPVFLRSELLWE